jgi:hypothetical protein
MPEETLEYIPFYIPIYRRDYPPNVLLGLKNVNNKEKSAVKMFNHGNLSPYPGKKSFDGNKKSIFVTMYIEK